jgi:hypothetical protein
MPDLNHSSIRNRSLDLVPSDVVPSLSLEPIPQGCGLVNSHWCRLLQGGDGTSTHKIADTPEKVPQTVCDFWCKKLPSNPSFPGSIVEQ